MAKGINSEEKNLLLGAGLLAIIYFGILRPITNKLGLTQAAKDKILSQVSQLASGSNGWNPNFYKDYTSKYSKWTLLTSVSASALAKKIYDAWGFFNDDESAIYAAFRSLRSQLMLSQVCDKYTQLYNRDLLTDLKAPWYYLHDGLDDKEFAEVAKIVNALPVNVTT